MSVSRGLILSLRNGVAFVAMTAIFAAALAVVIHSLAWFNIEGIDRLTIAFGTDALCGAVGYFVFVGSASIRTWLVFLSVIAVGALMVLLYDPGKTFYPLLTSLPFAAVAALSTRMMALYLEKKPTPHVDA